MALPGMVSALLAPKMIHSHLRLQSITFFNMMLEVLIKKSELKIVKLIRKSKIFCTFTFMIISGIIMNFLQKGNINQFWLISPAKVKNNENTKHCSHEGKSCLNYLKDGIIKYTTLGLILEISRRCISLFSILFKNPFKFLSTVVSSLKFRLTLFLACYVGIFRMVSCLLCFSKKKDSPDHSKIAGFFSGIAFFIYPQYQIYTLALTKCVEISWNYASQKIKSSSSSTLLFSLVKRIQTVPILWLMRFISLGVMYHTALFYPHLSPAFNHKAFNLCSNDA
ncbi:uncharacterized protein LOC134828767 [Culicoides brevitarsis]|uniref:uncharacterized protein LOC134828767 n=1 Tax=Culicoides brevitarsis TaxID=469753 RepID=UPI00307C2FF2